MGQTIAGGYYADADGKGFHDSSGRPVEKVGEKVLQKQIEGQADLTPEQLDAQARQAQAQLAAEDAERKAQKAQAEAKAAAKEAQAHGKKR